MDDQQIMERVTEITGVTAEMWANPDLWDDPTDTYPTGYCACANCGHAYKYDGTNPACPECGYEYQDEETNSA